MRKTLACTIFLLGIASQLTACKSTPQRTPEVLLKIVESYYLLDDYDEAEAWLAKIPHDSPQHELVPAWREKISQAREKYVGIGYNRTRTQCGISDED